MYEDMPRYPLTKGSIAMNVLGAHFQDVQFIHVLLGWKDSLAHDGWVLWDAMSRRNELKIPNGYYYLIDARCTNGVGFLTPVEDNVIILMIRVRDTNQQHLENYFNMKHSVARNVTELCLGLLKLQWAIPRSPFFYPIQTQWRIIMACCLLHNLIRKEMPIDSLEQELNDHMEPTIIVDDHLIEGIESSDEWNMENNNSDANVQFIDGW